ncbi:protein of unassigned function [Methylobacterium oryzae CBMB20]|uniref:Protein of unassigned function n=1 Tax=Methylobacterium oryzae CBMB20 TaxID=693986 RepID=A0A089P355_9HYPH|nr:protein of unassigned function [Methylobacterium oryzae CBMB20]
MLFVLLTPAAIVVGRSIRVPTPAISYGFASVIVQIVIGIIVLRFVPGAVGAAAAARLERHGPCTVPPFLAVGCACRAAPAIIGFGAEIDIVAAVARAATGARSTVSIIVGHESDSQPYRPRSRRNTRSRGPLALDAVNITEPGGSDVRGWTERCQAPQRSIRRPRVGQSRAGRGAARRLPRLPRRYSSSTVSLRRRCRWSLSRLGRPKKRSIGISAARKICSSKWWTTGTTKSDKFSTQLWRAMGPFQSSCNRSASHFWIACAAPWWSRWLA